VVSIDGNPVTSMSGQQVAAEYSTLDLPDLDFIIFAPQISQFATDKDLDQSTSRAIATVRLEFVSLSKKTELFTQISTIGQLSPVELQTITSN
jgi:hypothetical protein